MFAVLQHYGISEIVMVDGYLSDPFDVTTGVLRQSM